MSRSGLLPVQQALYAALVADVSFMALVSGVHDAVPRRAAKPYVTMGESTEIPYNTFGKIGHEDTVTLHVYTEDDGAASGKAAGLAIVERLLAVLDGARLVVQGHDTVLCNFEFTNTIEQSDDAGLTYRNFPVRFRIVTQDAG